MKVCSVRSKVAGWGCAVALVVLPGCAIFGGSRTTGVPIDKRPTPQQPAANDTAMIERIQVEPVVKADERAQLMQRIVADTTEAGAAVRRCRGRKLLPDQESVIEATLNLLAEARAALRLDELSRAESNARKAKALSSSLRCP